MRISDWSSDVCSSDLGAERDLPYERPPLSKDYLSGTKSFESLLIRPANFWIERNVRTLMGRQVTDVFPEARSVELADSASLGYGKLIWATGGAPRRLACAGNDQVGGPKGRQGEGVEESAGELP